MPWERVENSLFINPYNFVPLEGDRTVADSEDAQAQQNIQARRIDPRLAVLGALLPAQEEQAQRGAPPRPRDSVFPNGIVRNTISEQRGALTGKITCQMTLKTPLSMPDHQNETNNEGHHMFPFLKKGDRPFIPGSELRGMVRSVFEAATHSCLSVLDDEPVSARNSVTSGNQKPKPGVLRKENGVWKLYPATEYLILTYSPTNGQPEYQINNENGMPYISVNEQRFTNGSRISFDASQTAYVTSGGLNTGKCYAVNLGNGNEIGFLLLGEKGERKYHHTHHSHILKTNFDGHEVEIAEESIERLQSVLKAYRDDTMNLCLEKRSHSGYRGLELREDGTPIFYRALGHGDNTTYYFSPAFMGREAYAKRISMLAGDYAPCNGREGIICPACALFGMIGEHNSYGSALRFGDASYIGEPIYRAGVTLKELAGPKISATEFYLSSPDNANSWTYDYVRTNAGATLTTMQLRGRKFYLHHNNFQLDKAKTNEVTIRNATVDLLMPNNGSHFTFDVYFNGISERQLKQLLWSLAPVGRANNDGTRAPLTHKLGFGKPLGLGSVDVKVLDVKMRTFEAGVYAENSMTQEEIDTEILLAAASVPESLQKALDYETTGNTEVRYPIGTNRNREQGTHYWFVGNRRNATNPNVDQTLPELSSSSLAMNDVKEFNNAH